MYRQMLLDHLAEAERHVDQGAALLERERTILEERRRDGHPVGDAQRLLETMQELQEMHVAHRERLRQELAKLG